MRVPDAALSDRMRWYCRSGKHVEPTIIREVAFHCVDLGTQLEPHINVRRLFVSPLCDSVREC